MGPVPERRVKLNPNVQQKPIGKLPPDAYVPDTNLNPYERATAHAVHELDNAIGIAKSVDDSKKLAVTQDAYSLACQRIETIWANIKKEQQSRKAALDIFLGPRIAPAFQKSIDRSKIAVIDTEGIKRLTIESVAIWQASGAIGDFNAECKGRVVPNHAQSLDILGAAIIELTRRFDAIWESMRAASNSERDAALVLLKPDIGGVLQKVLRGWRGYLSPRVGIPHAALERMDKALGAIERLRQIASD